MNVTIKAQKQLTSVPEFERILLRVNPDGSAVRLRDVARVELGQKATHRRPATTASLRRAWASSWLRTPTP